MGMILSAINVNSDTGSKAMNAKPMSTISYQCQQGHKFLRNQCQTNGQDLVSYQFNTETAQLSMSSGTQAHKQSMPNQWV